MEEIDAIKRRYKQQVSKALDHLKYSHGKIKTLPFQVKQLNEDQLESWESLIARFSRVTDIFLNKFLRSIVISEEAGFRGTLRDLLNWSAKHHIISDVDRWMAIRELRNRAAHEYLEDRLEDLFVSVRSELEFVLSEIEAALSK